MRKPVAIAVVAVCVACAASLRGQQPPAPSQQKPETAFRFKSGVELINVTATFVEANGRFVPGLRQEDFLVYEDDQPQTVTHFSADRVPVSLGIALDTSQSMAGEKIQAAQRARSIDFSWILFGPEDKFFLCPVQRPAGADPELDHRSRGAQPRAESRRAQRADGDVRHDRGSRAARAGGQEPEEGARGDFRRRRHDEHNDRSARQSA